MGIYSLNRAEWFITEQACNAYSFVSIPLYDTLGEFLMLLYFLSLDERWTRNLLMAYPGNLNAGSEAVEFIVNQSRLTVLVCTADKVSSILQNVHNMPSIQYIIEMDYQGSKLIDAKNAGHAQRALSSGIKSNNKVNEGGQTVVHGVLDYKQLQQMRNGGYYKERESERGVQITTMRDVERLGESNLYPHNPPQSNDLTTVCYTSGTTGNPKGVMLTHANFCAALAGANASGVEIYPSDVHLSYLPLAHVFERLVQLLLVHNAAAIAFFQGDVTKLTEDLQELRPTIFPSVPRLYNRIYDKVLQGVAAAGGTKKALFDYAFASKKVYLQSSNATTHAIWDRLVFKKIRDMLGGRIRLLITGSAPMSAEVKHFLQIAFSCPIVEGYGLTETVGVATVTPFTERSPGHVGAPSACTEIKLVDIPDMGYTHIGKLGSFWVIVWLLYLHPVLSFFFPDKPNPRGELCVRGPNVFVGYYKNPEETAVVIDKQGWFHTGDVALMNKNGTVSIIDRKKNIFKLSQGEYVAPDKIENVYTKSPLIAQAFVYGDSLQPHLVGVVVPDPEVAADWAKEHNVRGLRPSQRCCCLICSEAWISLSSSADVP